MIVINEDIVVLQHTIGGKFQSLIDELNSLQSSIINSENQFGQLGMVTKIESLLERTMSKKLGWNVKIIPDIDSNYIRKISIATRVPTIILSRKFTTDFIKAIKQGDCKSVLAKLKNDLKSKAQEVVNQGTDPFEERFNYIMIEASTVGGSFHAALPVNALSLVDTDDDNAYVAKEVKKDHFILKPTKEYLQKTLRKALESKKLTEEQRQKYLQIIHNGVYRIIKEHIQESASKHYKIFGNRVVISNIYSKE